MALVVVQGVLPLASPYLMKRTIDALGTGISAHAGLEGFRPVLYWVVLALVVAVVSSLFNSLAGLAAQYQSIVFADKVTDLVLGKSIAVDMEYYENSDYYDTMYRAQTQAATRPLSVVNRLVAVGRNAVSLVGITGLLLALNPLVALVLFFVALPGALVQTLYARRQYRLAMELTEKERQSGYYYSMATGSGPAKEIRLFDLGNLFRSRYRALRAQLRGARLKLTQRQAATGWFAQLMTSFAVYGSLAFIAYQAYMGAITVGSLIMYYSVFQLAVSSFSGILTGLAGLYEDNLFLSNFYGFLALQPRLKVPASPKSLPPKPNRIVSFRDVSFQYPGGTRRALDAVNLTVEPGQVIALVGENGSGKTTLVKLLCRLYDPETGSVTVNGVDIRQVDPVDWRRQVSVILQDYVQYHLKAWENIWLGDVESEPNRARIIEAARRSGADSAIRRLPEGYDTQLGYWFKRGRELSIGEWQKVALARAFLRDSQIVVLDEPTSSLDPLAEAEVFERFRAAVHGRSAILISHRFSTVRMADRIYVLDKGRIAESGTHVELLKHQGIYARLYLTQAATFQQGSLSDHPIM